MISALPVSGAWVPKMIGRPLGPAEDLVHERELHLPVALAAELGAEVAGPQALVAHLLLEGIDHLAQRVVEGWKALPPHTRSSGSISSRTNAVHPVELLLELRFGREVPRHRSYPPLDAPSGRGRRR